LFMSRWAGCPRQDGHIGAASTSASSGGVEARNVLDTGHRPHASASF
jgi:hypothetical protein